ncbi:MAG: hypothetical protein RI907_3852 [Pseudomonadota bacterium]|jgi:hypothetical protein
MFASEPLCLRAVPLAVLLAWSAVAWGPAQAADTSNDVNVAVPAATCGPGSNPETGLQGQVPLGDRVSGRSKQGYACNMELVGQFQGEGTAVVSAVAGKCAYFPTSYSVPDKKKLQGVQVVDVSDPAHPKWVKSLDTRAFHVGTWESLKTSPDGKLLAGAGVGLLTGAGKLDLYDVTDCANPKLLNKAANKNDSMPVTNMAHEGDWSPDSKTYWTASTSLGTLSAIDVSNPAAPKNLYFGGSHVFVNHGLSFNADGTRMYLASIFPAGIAILDVSDIQNRKASPRIRQISKITWQDGTITQRAIPVTIKGKPFLIVHDEFGGQGVMGGLRFIDITDEKNPVVVSHIRLGIQLKENAEAAKADLAGSGIFAYDAHYCDVDRKTDPTALACGYFNSGIRVFNIQDHLRPKEIAYFNPPAQTGRNNELLGSDHAFSPAFGSLAKGKVPDPSLFAATQNGRFPDLTADWCSSPPRFVNNQIWVTCNDNGFMALKFTNGAYPIR